MIFDPCTLEEPELAVIERIRELKKKLQYITGDHPRRWGGLLRRNAMARAIRGSNSIEGYNVTIDDALAAAEGEEPLEADGETWSAILGYRRAMTYVLQLGGDPHFEYSPNLIRSLHYMMLEHDLAKNPGRWRPGSIYVWDDESRQVVYEGPDADEVPGLISELVQSFHHGADENPAVVRAAMAHLNLVMIHPFSDGNGRMARCLQTLVLARSGTLSAQFASIEEYLGRNTLEYYSVLAEVGRGKWSPSNQTRPWIRFCLTAHFRQASTLLRRMNEIEALWGIIEGELKKHGLPDRLIFAVAEAAIGLRVRNSTYRTVADVSAQVASRDLKAAVDAGIMISHGQKRGAFYVASPELRAIHSKVAMKNQGAVDPFVEFESGALLLPGLEDAFE